jgi:hypothetical protein
LRHLSPDFNLSGTIPGLPATVDPIHCFQYILIRHVGVASTELLSLASAARWLNVLE